MCYLAVNIAIPITIIGNTDFMLENKIQFTQNRVPHITLFQMYVHVNDVSKVQRIVSSYTLPTIEYTDNTICYSLGDQFIYQTIITSDDLIKLHRRVASDMKSFVCKLGADKYTESYPEEITFTPLFDLVNGFESSYYKPHITLGFSSSSEKLENVSFEMSRTIKLYRIGDYGTALQLAVNRPLYFAHRINTQKELTLLDKQYGLELDLRDSGNRLILQHDPFGDGEEFEKFLKHYHHKSIILNIKSERIEHRVLELLNKYKVTNYFFLDSSFPMINTLSNSGEKKIAVRFSEYESLESIQLVKDMVEWVWVDCFTRFPLDKKSYDAIKKWGLKICLVSPELQKHNLDMITNIKKSIYLHNMKIDAICTKVYNIHKWSL